jgi:hypothetical protein
LVRILHQNGGGKYYFMDTEPSKDPSIDEFFMEVMPPLPPSEKPMRDEAATSDITGQNAPSV